MEADPYFDDFSGLRSWDPYPPSPPVPQSWPGQQRPDRHQQRPPRPPRPPRKRLRRVGRILAYLTIAVVGLDLLVEGYFISLNWVNPPVTAYMLENSHGRLHDYVSLQYVSRYLVEATLAHEDAQLPTRFTGLDWRLFWGRASAYLNQTANNNGSPIPEQLTKNLLLWPSKIPLRKALDAVLAEQLVHAVSKQRVLELYLNEAQFGPKIYGVCDATWYYFDDAPDDITVYEAAELMGVLPEPVAAFRLPGGGLNDDPNTPDGQYVNGDAVRWVPKEIKQNGGGLALVQQLGITSLAHGQPNGPGDCRTMPPDIRQLIAEQRSSTGAS